MFRSRSLREKDGIKELKGGLEVDNPRSSPRWAFPILPNLTGESKFSSRSSLRALRRGAAVGASDAGKETKADPPQAKPGGVGVVESGVPKAAPDVPGTPQAAPRRQPIMRSRTSDSAADLVVGGGPVGWPLRESALRLSSIKVPSGGEVGGGAGVGGASSVPASPRSTHSATPRTPSVFATEAALTAELQAKEAELRAHRVKQAEAEAAAKAMEAQWKAEVAAAAAAMAEMRKAKEALEAQLEIASKEIEQSSGKGRAKRARAGPSDSSSSPSSSSSSASSSAPRAGSDVASGSGGVTVRPGGRLGTVLEEGAICEDDSEEEFQWLGSDPSPSQQLGRLKLENVVLKELVTGLEAERASLKEQLESLKSQGAASEGEGKEMKSQLLAAEAKIAELECQNAALLLQVSTLGSESSFLFVTKSGASYDLFCAS